MRLPAPLLRRNPKAYKNQFGHVLVIAGSSRMLGAAALCGLSAFRTGAGLVTIGVPLSLNSTLQSKIPNEIMTLPLPESTGHLDVRAVAVLEKQWNKYQVMAIGPGLGQRPSTKRLVLNIIRQCPLPLVVDADALNFLSEDPNVLMQAQGARILTPHPGEMARLTGLSMNDIENNRLKTAKEFAKRYHCVLVLKGSQTVVASALGQTFINRTGNSGMATAGAGDVLTGMIAALIGQGLDPFESAKHGCHWHGRAGDLAARTFGKASLIASDIIDNIPRVLHAKGGK